MSKSWKIKMENLKEKHSLNSRPAKEWTGPENKETTLKFVARQWFYQDTDHNMTTNKNTDHNMTRDKNTDHNMTTDKETNHNMTTNKETDHNMTTDKDTKEIIKVTDELQKAIII